MQKENEKNTGHLFFIALRYSITVLQFFISRKHHKTTKNMKILFTIIYNIYIIYNSIFNLTKICLSKKTVIL